MLALHVEFWGETFIFFHTQKLTYFLIQTTCSYFLPTLKHRKMMLHFLTVFSKQNACTCISNVTFSTISPTDFVHAYSSFPIESHIHFNTNHFHNHFEHVVLVNMHRYHFVFEFDTI